MGFINWLAHTPNAPKRNGWMATAATLPYLVSKTYQHLDENQSITPSIILPALPSLAAFLTAYIGTICLHSFTEKNTGTKKGDYKKLREIKKQLEQQQPPNIEFNGDASIGYSFLDAIKNVAIPFYRPSAESLEKRAQQEKDPMLALDSAIKFGGKRGEYDKALIIMRDALKWLDGKKPSIKKSTRIGYAYYELMLKTARAIQPRDISNYVISAIYESIMKPEHAWYWTQLGRMVADAFDTPNKKEMYVFHALLAHAQNRSDKKEAFKDAFKLLQETCTPQRLGESRNPVWTLDDTKFFSETFAFKGNESRKELENEWNAAITLENILDETATIPQPIHLTDEPNNGQYVYVMRYLKGELLAKQLKEGNKNGLGKVIPVLARILSRYPTEGLQRVDIEEKTYKKLEKLGMKDAMPFYKPVIEDLKLQKVWTANKDAHPEQWQLDGSKVGVLDTEIKEIQPAILDSANLLEYCGTFNPVERKVFVTQLAYHLQQENIPIGNSMALFRAHSNATIHRALCLITAWNEKNRNKTKEEKEHVINNAIRAANDIKADDPEYYQQYKEQYDKLPEIYAKLMPS